MPHLSRIAGAVIWQGVVDVPLVDMSGKVVLVTGCTVGGIGLATATKLAEFGATLLLTCRTEEKGKAAVEAIRSEVKPSADVYALLLDTSDMESVRACVDQVREKLCGRRLDVLVANAGVCCQEYQQTTAGVEYTFATAALGHFLMTRLLTPKRAVWLTGDIYITADGPADPHFVYQSGKGGEEAYKRSCLARLLLAKELRKRYSGEKVANDQRIEVACVHPGVIVTNLMQSGSMAKRIASWFLLSAEQGGRSAALLASCPSAQYELSQPHYYHNKHGWYRLEETDPALDDVAAKKLYEQCEQLCAL